MDKISPSKDDIAEAKSKHGDVWILRSSLLDVLVKCPSPDQFGAFQLQLMSGEDQKVLAPRNLFFGSLVWPSRSEFEAAIKNKPGVSVRFQQQMTEICGLNEKVELEKL